VPVKAFLKNILFYFQLVGFVAVTRRRMIIKSGGVKGAGDSQLQQQDYGL